MYLSISFSGLGGGFRCFSSLLSPDSGGAVSPSWLSCCCCCCCCCCWESFINSSFKPTFCRLTVLLDGIKLRLESISLSNAVVALTSDAERSRGSTTTSASVSSAAVASDDDDEFVLFKFVLRCISRSEIENLTLSLLPKLRLRLRQLLRATSSTRGELAAAKLGSESRRLRLVGDGGGVTDASACRLLLAVRLVSRV